MRLNAGHFPPGVASEAVEISAEVPRIQPGPRSDEAVRIVLARTALNPLAQSCGEGGSTLQ